MAAIRVGLIGAGGIARDRHLPGLKAAPGVEIVAVCNRTRATAEQAAADYGIPRVTTDWREVIAMPDVQAVVVAAPPYLHCPATVAALAAGKHVLCEARMAMNVAEARQMLAAAQAAPGLVTMLVPGPMILAVEPYLKRRLAEGYVGRPCLVRVQALGGAFADPALPLHWRQTPDISGVNTLMVGIYAEIIQRLLGDTLRLTALGTVSIAQRIDPRSGATRAVEYPDTLTITAEMSNGAQAVYEFSEALRHPPAHRVEIYGSDGSLVYDRGTGQLLGGRAGQPLQALPIPADLKGEWQVEATFIAGIRAGQAVWPTFADGVKYMAFTEAAVISAQTGRAVSLAAV